LGYYISDTHLQIKNIHWFVTMLNVYIHSFCSGFSSNPVCRPSIERVVFRT